MEKTCQACKYFQPVEGVRPAASGECRFNMPSVNPTLGELGRWPHVLAVDWCGVFRLKGIPQ